MFKEDYLKSHLKDILSEESYSNVRDEISRFPNTKNYYCLTWENPNFIMQWDGIRNFKIFQEDTKPCNIILRSLLSISSKLLKHWLVTWTYKEATAFIVSNTCDIDLENTREFNQPNIVFSPIIELERYRLTLLKSGIPEAKVNGHLQAIRRQEPTSIFYLPESQYINESIVFFDRLVNTMDVKSHTDVVTEKRVFILSQVAFYILLIKIWIHFSRPWEKIDRNWLFST